MRALLITICMMLCLSCNASCSNPAFPSEIYEAETIKDALPEQAEALMAGYQPEQNADFFPSLSSFLQDTLKEQHHNMVVIFQSALRTLLIIGLSQAFALSNSRFSKKVASFTAVLGAMSFYGETFFQDLDLTEKAIEQITIFAEAFFPVLSSISVSSGSLSGAASTYALTILFSNILSWMYQNFLLPVLLGLLSYSFVDAATEQSCLEGLCSFSCKLISKSLKLIVYLFTGAITISGVIAEAQDAAALKALRFSISTSIPVVGGILSNAAETVLSGTAYLKNTVGTYGMLAILATAMMPFLRLGIAYLLIKAVGALCSVWESRASHFVDTLANCTGYLMAIIGCCLYLNLLSCVSFIRMVQL